MSFAAQDTNLYRYVYNSPSNATDPSGQVVVLPVAYVAMGLAAAAAAYLYATAYVAQNAQAMARYVQHGYDQAVREAAQAVQMAAAAAQAALVYAGISRAEVDAAQEGAAEVEAARERGEATQWELDEAMAEWARLSQLRESQRSGQNPPRPPKPPKPPTPPPPPSLF